MISLFNRLAQGRRQREADDERTNISRRKLPPKSNLGLQILHDCDKPTVDIVAVHGLGAIPDLAWVWLPKNNPPDSRGYPDKPFNWLMELLPEDLDCRVMAFNYDSTWISKKSAPQQRLSNISDNLLHYLGDNRNKTPALDRPLIFIGHSFGGNIIEQAIVSSSRHDSLHLRISQCTVGVIFLGTPHRGSPAAAWGAIIASVAPPGFITEKRLLKALEDQSDALTDRLHDFACWLFSESVPVVCAFEKLMTDYSSRLGVVGNIVRPRLVVPESSARIDGHCGIPLDTDHFKINKFYGVNDPSFKLIYPEILRIARGANEALIRRRNPKILPTSEISTSGTLKKCLQQMKVKNPEHIPASIEMNTGKTVGHTCEWILKEAEFCMWSTSDKSQFLRLIGSPGIGKTMMSTFLARVLKAKVEKSQGLMFAYFFCDDKDENRKTATAILRSLIWQLLVQNNELFEHMQPDFENYTDSSVFEDLFSDFSALWRIFERMVQDTRVGEIFILIDALDECEASTRRDLVISIGSFFRAPGLFGGVPGRVKVLTTCRPDIDYIDNELIGVGTPLTIDSAHISNDLSEYIDAKVDELALKKQYAPQIRAKVSDTLKQQIGGTFLWASLMVAELGRPEVRMLDVDAMLKRLPKGLNDIYAAILDRINPANRDYAQFILRCMVATRRPLKVTEMRTAFAAWKTDSMQSGEDLLIYDDILTVCSSILYESKGDEPTVNFCHQSVKDFLLHERLPTNKWYHTAEDEANLCIFRVCWTYLSAEEFNYGNPIVGRDGGKAEQLRDDRDSILGKDLSQYLFLDYSRSEWENHAMASSTVLLRDRQGLAIDVAKAPRLRDAWLLRAAREGHVGIVQWLLDNGADIEAKRSNSRTVLWDAVSDGHTEIVRLLLDRDANIEAKDYHSQTPLSAAARHKHEAIVRVASSVILVNEA